MFNNSPSVADPTVRKTRDIAPIHFWFRYDMNAEEFTNRVPPPLLFRYSSVEVTQQFIADPHLRFSDPTTFNDPFEFRPEIKLRVRGSDLLEILKANQLPPDISIGRAECILARAIHEDAAQHYHVLCFTEDAMSPLMWAHYARSHTGCVLGFDSDLFAPFRTLKQTAGPVIYDDVRPRIGIPVSDEYGETVRAIFTKGTSWAYEREWRLALVHKKSERTSHREFKFDPNLLRLIIAGARCGDVQFVKIRKALKANSALKHVELVRASVDDSGFRLRLKRRNDATFDLLQFTNQFEHRRHARRERGQTWYADSMRRRALRALA